MLFSCIQVNMLPPIVCCLGWVHRSVLLVVYIYCIKGLIKYKFECDNKHKWFRFCKWEISSLGVFFKVLIMCTHTHTLPPSDANTLSLIHILSLLL